MSETDDILMRMQQSDHILCTNINNLHFSAKQKDDAPFMHAFGRSLPKTIRNVSGEYKLWTDTFTTRFDVRTPMIVNRGQVTSYAQNAQNAMFINPTVIAGQYQIYENMTRRQ